MLAAGQAGEDRTVSSRESRAFVGAVDELAELCRRNPRVRQAAQASLLPPELAAAIAL